MNRGTRFRIFMRDGFTCQYCGAKAPATELHVDHRFPRSKGGKDTDDNLVTACIACNSGKSATVLPTAFLYVGGHKDGQTVRRCDQFPVEWVWQMKDGTLWSLNDAYIADGDGETERVACGPFWFEHPESPSRTALMAAVDASRDEHRSPQCHLLGAYSSIDRYRGGDSAMLSWLTPADLLLSLNFVAASGPRLLDP